MVKRNEKLEKLIIVLGVVFFVGCAKKQVIKPPELTPLIEEETGVEEVKEETPAVEVSTETVTTEPDLWGKEFTETPELTSIYFDYDQYNIRSDAQKVLNNYAKWLKEHPQLEVLIEGHCDERGSTEYNLGLGQRRVTTTRNYLLALGVPAGNLTTLSYGEEMPVCPEHNEDCWWKNRRAQFKVRMK